MTEWQEFVKNQVRLQGGNIQGPKLLCINIQPYGSTQAPERSDILNIGGFSDAVFNGVAAYPGDDANRFVAEVESIELKFTRFLNRDTLGLSNRTRGVFVVAVLMAIVMMTAIVW